VLMVMDGPVSGYDRMRFTIAAQHMTGHSSWLKVWCWVMVASHSSFFWKMNVIDIVSAKCRSWCELQILHSPQKKWRFSRHKSLVWQSPVTFGYSHNCLAKKKVPLTSWPQVMSSGVVIEWSMPQITHGLMVFCGFSLGSVLAYPFKTCCRMNVRFPLGSCIGLSWLLAL
jgi:hypothetical protein